MKTAAFAFLFFIPLSCNNDANDVNVKRGEAKRTDSSSAAYDAVAFSSSPYCTGTGDISQDASENQAEFIEETDLQGFNIVGGQVLSRSNLAAKSTVKLHIMDHHCSATLIGPRHLVTAAHCFDTARDASYTRVGVKIDGYPLDEVKVEQLSIHPKYVGIKGHQITGEYLDMNFYDIASIVLDRELPGMKPVGIGDSSLLKRGSEVILAGYGYYSEEDQNTDVLRKLSGVFTQVTRVNKSYQDIQLEANNRRGPCFGDSGGPLYVRHPENKCLLVLGSVTGHSRGDVYSCEQGGGTITDVSSFQGWLKCSFEKAGAPLNHLKDDASRADCSK